MKDGKNNAKPTVKDVDDYLTALAVTKSPNTNARVLIAPSEQVAFPH